MSKQSIFFKQAGLLKHLNTDEIVVMEANDNYVKLFSDQGIFTVRITLDAALSQLPANQFLRVSRTHAVAIEHIDSISKEILKVRDVIDEIPVSRQYYPKIIKQITILDEAPPKLESQPPAEKNPRSLRK